MEVDPSGCIGGGQDTPTPVDLYRCPPSTEAWLHRIVVTSPEVYSRLQTTLQIGRTAMHGDNRWRTYILLAAQRRSNRRLRPRGKAIRTALKPRGGCTGCGPKHAAGIHLRFDLQVILVSGLSEFTPRKQSPTNLDAGCLTATLRHWWTNVAVRY